MDARRENISSLAETDEDRKDAVAALAETEGFEVIAEFVEVETGKGSDALDRRPELSAALGKARASRCPVVVRGRGTGAGR